MLTFVSTRGVIDVGTNSVKLLVAEVGVEGVRPLLEQRCAALVG